MEKREDELVVEGYRFATIADAETARMELKKIENLERNLDYRRPQNVLLVYNRALDNRVFLTPVGFSYLQKMQKELIKWGVPADKVRPVPLYATFSNKTANSRSIRLSVAQRHPEYQGRFVASLLVNFVLVVLVAAMVLFAWNSDTPNIINYRQAIENEYSAWEQELTQREQTVREEKRKLGMQGTN
ncbi:MAG: hypothetical protein OSJ72_04050 [Lachnospiraceae bacterium]|nr:hypothetical protein [Lachnospiraceae bacterium]